MMCLQRQPIPFASVLAVLMALEGWACLVPQAPLSNQTQEQESRLIEGLRERRLFDLAERHCQKMLALPGLEPGQLADFTIELIKTRTARALLAEPENRDSQWIAAIETGNQFLQLDPDHPRQFLLRVQIALCHLAYGRLLRQELAADMVAEPARDKALVELRAARRQLNTIQREITRTIPDRRHRSLKPDELSSEQLMALNRNIQLQLAVVDLNRAQLYPSDDRINRNEALNQVITSVTSVQRETSQGQPLWWESQLLEIECRRLLGDFDQAANLLKKLNGTFETGDMPQSLLEQQLKLSAETGNQDAAVEALRSCMAISNREPSLDLARLIAVVALANQTTANEKQEWLKQASQLTRLMEQQHGSYWGRRAELLLIHSSGARTTIKSNENQGPTTTELDLMIRLADQAMRKKRYADAVKAYDSAAETARQLADADRMFRLGVRASQALEKQGLHREAAERLIRLANRNPSLNLAAAAHLRGCWNWAQTIEDDSDRQIQFGEILEQHLTRWPESTTVNQARIWMAGQLQENQRWKAAFNQYAAISPTSPLFADALRRAVHCAEQWMQTALEREKADVVANVTDQLEQVWRSAGSDTNSASAALLALAEFGLENGSIPEIQLVGPLQQLIANPGESASTKSRARVWLLICLSRDPANSVRVDQLISEIGDQAELLKQAERGLASMGQEQSGENRVLLNRLRLKIAEKALDTGLTEAARSRWLFTQADALAEVGRWDDAISMLTQLEQQKPAEVAIKLRLARLVSRQADTGTALARWRRLAIRLKPHSEAWFEAKYNIAKLMVQSGEKKEAQKLLEYIRATPPGWNKSSLRSEFEQLLRQCQTP
jgi:tetratricopeptide (TPR) repeat protein